MSNLGARLSYYFERAGLPVRRRELLVFEKELRAGEADSPEVPGAVLSCPSASELQDMNYPGGWLSKEEAIEWLRTRDCQMLAASRDGAIAAYCWVETEYAELSFFDLRSPLLREEVYISHVFVTPGTRGSGLGTAIVGAALAMAASQGKRRATIACVRGNQPMRAMFARQGWTWFQTVAYLRGAWFRLFSVSDAEGRTRRYLSPASAAAPVLNCFSGLAPQDFGAR
jgi:GNAT superfamily N-acetyltransferase